MSKILEMLRASVGDRVSVLGEGPYSIVLHGGRATASLQTLDAVRDEFIQVSHPTAANTRLIEWIPLGYISKLSKTYESPV